MAAVRQAARAPAGRVAHAARAVVRAAWALPTAVENVARARMAAVADRHADVDRLVAHLNYLDDWVQDDHPAQTHIEGAITDLRALRALLADRGVVSRARYRVLTAAWVLSIIGTAYLALVVPYWTLIFIGIASFGISAG